MIEPPHASGAAGANASPHDVGFGIYVHWPFCLAKCPYCDFNSHVRLSGVDADAFTAGLLAELTHFSELTRDRTVTSVFFGGGTPSLMPEKSVAEIIEQIGALWRLAPNAEITLEANPTSADSRRFAGYRAAGVNRVSIGVQALNDKDLKALGRQHNVNEALAAFRLAAQIFDRTSFDLIYARPGQTIAQWREELTMALGEQQGHMSLYQLTIEPDTAFEKLYAAGKLIVPEDDLAAQLYDVTQELTDKHNLPAYEISNHARPDAQSRHNLLYWRYGEYVGVGAGAHSRLLVDQPGQTRIGLSNEKHPERWLQKVLETGSGVVEQENLQLDAQAQEFLLMGLRLLEGVNLFRLQALFHTKINTEKINDLAEEGLISFDAHRGQLCATSAGRRVLNGVIAYLAAES